MAKILECTLNPRVAPGRVLLRHSPNELVDFVEDTRTTHALPRARRETRRLALTVALTQTDALPALTFTVALL